MRHRAFVIVALAGIAIPAGAQQPAPASSPGAPGARAPITLDEAIRRAREHGLAAVAAKSSRDAARSRDRAFTARLLPQLALEGNAADLDRGINPITLPTGETKFVTQSQNQSAMNLTLAQRLPWTGGRLTVGSQVSRIDLFGESNTQYWQTTPLLVGLQQDIFKPRALIWEQRQQEHVASIAEQQYLEQREDVAAGAVGAFFDLHAASLALENAVSNVAVNDTLYVLNKGRYEVGKIGENDLLQSELALLRSRASVDGARLERDRAEAALRRLLRIPVGEPIALASPPVAPQLAVDTALAMQQALANSSASEEVELGIVQARRRVSEARFANLPGATVSAMVGFNQTAPVFSQAYQALTSRQRLQVGVSMPVWQWGAGRADLAAAHYDEDRAKANAQSRREAISEEARFAARNLMQTRRVLEISEKADTVASKRFEVAKNRYVIGRIGITDLYIAQSEKDQALQAYIGALRSYWTAYYRLRRVTLYDFAARERIAP
ncbi:MAG TPA: TolC family protein [Gemmatimonadaceae bacterium]